MKKYSIFYFLLALFLLLQACTSENEQQTNNEDVAVEKLTFDQRKERHITGSLAMDATEKYSTETYKEKINNDEFEDAIITVNRLDFAKNKARNLKNGRQIAEMGYIGNYNYFVFYDGRLDKFSVPVLVPSSSLNKLKVSIIPGAFTGIDGVPVRVAGALDPIALLAVKLNEYSIPGSKLVTVYAVKFSLIFGKF